MPIIGDDDLCLTGRSMPVLLNYAYGPVGILQIHLKQTFHTQYQNLRGQLTDVESHPVPNCCFELEIPLCALSLSRKLCNRYIFNVLSNTNLFDLESLKFLAPKIADYAVSFTHGSFMGFLIRAVVDVSRVEVVVVDDVDLDEAIMELLRTMDEGDVVRNMGASRSAIEKLKKERRFDGDGDGELGTCMVCLEELSGVVELIKMPCSHLFHELCLCHWLEEKNSCPICRCEVDDDSN